MRAHGVVCVDCGKVCFASKAIARQRMKELQSRSQESRVPHRVYYNEGCGWWHLTAMPHRHEERFTTTRRRPTRRRRRNWR